MPHWHTESGHLRAGIDRDVAVLTLDRPGKLNALTGLMRRDLAAAIRHFGTGGRSRGVVVTGAGRAFSAGMDLEEAARLPEGGLVAEAESFNDITRAVLETSVPVVAALNGLAVGGAGELTLCFDARLASPAAGFYLPENATGLSISNAASVLLPRLVGHRALRLVMESARIDAETALALGLVDAVVPQPGLVGACVDLVHRWHPPGSATAAHLRLLRPPADLVAAAMDRESQAAAEVEASGIARAGIARFLDRPGA
ncbi:enoyl-CoA hydratase/isomerase family protein [Nonomuraea sp. MG754425]|uniref:enoyl-CoA hydratase/isomerase family protein n=1 Tax=Nonomuraea sp. MG754425 TaxID=2570319 RepID=UPI001F1BC96D|nr:enoyl-CoA hydratase/isomerase family protein [Nonomuraea sp. MG754425]MCF6471790.1 enoyl-CoA hydratase/isomerase family protein [Nonomuraea sp. MG754425]